MTDDNLPETLLEAVRYFSDLDTCNAYMIQHFYNKHWHAVTGSFHGDMAHAFKGMLNDMDFAGYFRDVQKVAHAIRLHIGLESNPQYKGRKWFTETFTA